ncbi:HNH endonuclease [Alkalihalobacterium elongatum]|uniref:HNH endonuclease n=1 Tax=Alkalihalobacterium elongatum TaxID=2675466 RepID=UPI001C1F4C2E|nr:HNH endonuclease signature motif containing protein [Alkalihalobacterium elongatum]
MRSSGKSRLLEHFKKNVGKDLCRKELSNVAGVHDWQRTIRSLRKDDGWDIETLKDGYRLNSLTQTATDTKREPINDKLRYAVLQRDLSTCQRCGRGIKDGVKLHIDHKTPVDMGGKSTLDNLWTLCEQCNLGKKNLFSDEDNEKMKVVLSQPSGYQKLKVYIELTPNKILEPEKLQIISNIRDWTRTLRDIRKKYSLNIKYIKPNEQYPSGAYYYDTEKE